MTNRFIAGSTAIALGGLLILSAALSDGRTGGGACLTRADVAQAQEQSRNGVSLTCTPEIRARGQHYLAAR